MIEILLSTILTGFAYFLLALLTLVIIALIYYRPRHPHPKNTYIVPITKWQEALFGQFYNFVTEETWAPQKRWMKAALAENKQVVSFDVRYNQRVCWLLDLDDIRYLLDSSREYSLLTKHQDYKFIREIIDPHYDGLITMTDADAHAEQKKLVLPAFSSKALRSAANYCFPEHCVKVDKELKEVAEKCRPGGEAENTGVGLSGILERFTLNVVVQASFKSLTTGTGIDVPEEFRKIGTIMNFTIADMLPDFIRKKLPTEKNRIIKESVGRIGRAADLMGEKVQKEHDAGEVREGQEVLLDYLVKEKDLSKGFRRAHIVTFLAAGSETTSRAISWACYHLARNPKVQQKLFESLVDAVGLHTHPSLDDLTDVPYLDCVIKETLRVSPPAATVGRDTLKDIRLPHSGVVVPKGFRVVFPIWNLHRHPEVWGDDEEDVNSFRPERWENNDELEEKLKAKPAAYMPFLIGVRSCTGRTFSLHEQKVAIASIIRSYELSWPKGEPDAKLKMKITLGFETDPNIIVKERCD